MPDSLKNLVNNLNNSNYEFPITKQIFSSVKNLSQNYFKLLIQKQIYPYEYMDNFDKFEEEKLPSREEFYSTLNYEQISEDDYTHACKIWNIFQIKNLGEYHDLYVLLDTCLLADVFQVFRKTSVKQYVKIMIFAEIFDKKYIPYFTCMRIIVFRYLFII